MSLFKSYHEVQDFLVQDYRLLDRGSQKHQVDMLGPQKQHPR